MAAQKWGKNESNFCKSTRQDYESTTSLSKDLKSRWTFYRKCPKSERSDFGAFRNRSFVLSFGFRISTGPKPNIRILDILASLDRFTWFFKYIKQSSLVKKWTKQKKMNQTNQTEWPKSEHKFVRFPKPKVRILDIYSTSFSQSILIKLPSLAVFLVWNYFRQL